MARRDYKDAGHARTGRENGGRRGIVPVLLIGAFLGLLLAAGLVWFFMPREGDFRKVESAPDLRIPPTGIATPAPGAPPAAPPVAPDGPATDAPGGKAADAPGYTFYDILPGNRAPKPLPPAQPRDDWWLQVAALKSEEDASALRARLILLGLDAVVQKTYAGKDVFYRIRVGPFDSEAAARPPMDTLRANNFEARLLKEAVTP